MRGKKEKKGWKRYKDKKEGSKKEEAEGDEKAEGQWHSLWCSSMDSLVILRTVHQYSIFLLPGTW